MSRDQASDDIFRSPKRMLLWQDSLFITFMDVFEKICSSAHSSSPVCLSLLFREVSLTPFVAIALPMGMSGDKIFSLSPSAQDILATLASAERLFWADLAVIARRGEVSRMRDAAVSLAMIRALQSSLGKAGKAGPVLAASLLGKLFIVACELVT